MKKEKSPIAPKFNRIVIIRHEKYIGGKIYIPPEVRNGSLKTSQGTVIAVGPNAEDVEIGDKVIFGRYAGNETTTKKYVMKDGVKKEEKTTYVCMNDEDLIGGLPGGFLDV